MARFDVFRNPDGGYLLDVQADALSSLNTRLVVPLMARQQAPLPAKHLNPVFMLEGREVVMVTQFLGAFPGSYLTDKVTSLADRHFEIADAIDLLLQGF